MAHIFDYRQSSSGVQVDTNYLFVNTSYVVKNNLFDGGGVIPGTISYIDPFRNEWVYLQTSLATTGGVDAGGVQDPNNSADVYYRDLYGNSLPASFDTSLDFTGIIGSQTEMTGYLRLFGITSPSLHWKRNAVSEDIAEAYSFFDANLIDMAADYAEQLNAIFARTVLNPIEIVTWGAGGGWATDTTTHLNPGFRMNYTPNAGTALTYGDFLRFYQDRFGRTDLSTQGDTDGGIGGIFGATETVQLILTAQDDIVNGTEMSAGTVIIDLGAGNDQTMLFFDESYDMPDLVRINAGIGADTVRVGAFFDTEITLGDGDDSLELNYNWGALGQDGLRHRQNVYGGAGDDGIGASSQYGILIADGGSGDDTIVGTGAADRITGGSGADRIVGGGASDAVDGGTGDDLLYGDTGNDTITGGSGDDVIFGNAGNDLLTGGSGNDRMFGTEGNDSYVVDAVDDIVNEAMTHGDNIGIADAGGTDMVQSTVSISLDAYRAIRFVEHLTLAGSSHINGIGNGLANRLTGNSGNNWLDGGAGNDSLYGGAGHDRIIDAAGRDQVFGGDGNDLFIAGADANTFAGGAGADTLDYAAYATAIRLDLANATTSGGATGNAAGNDSFSSIENAVGTSGNDTLFGSGAANRLWGDAGDDRLAGASGNDSLDGGEGADILYGGSGNDRLTGGAGADVFVFNTAPNASANLDTITGFSSIDMIRLDGDIFTGIGSSLTASEYRSITSGTSFGVVDSTDRIIYLQSTGQLFHDPDGSGSAVRVQFALIPANTVLGHGDFAMI